MNIPVVLPSSTIKIWDKSVKVFLSYAWIFKQRKEKSKTTPPRVLPLKVNPLKLKSLNQAKNIPLVLPKSPIKFWGKSVQGLPSHYQNSKNTTLYINLDICSAAWTKVVNKLINTWLCWWWYIKRYIIIIHLKKEGL